MGKKNDIKNPPVDSSADKTRSNIACSLPAPLRDVFGACAAVPDQGKSVVNVIDAAAKNGLSTSENVGGAQRNQDALRQVMDSMNGP